MAPKAEKKPAKKVAKTTDGGKKKGRKNKVVETYKIYIYKVLKQVRPQPYAKHSASSLSYESFVQA